MVKNYITAWEEVTESLVQAVKPVLHSRFWDDLSPRFFVTFWTLSMYDLEVPKRSYDRETEKLKLQISQTEDNKDLNMSKRKKDIERNRLLLEKLLEEQLKQDQHVSRVRARLDHEKDQWFQSSKKELFNDDLTCSRVSSPFFLLCRGCQDGNDNSVLAALFIPSLHLHCIRFLILCQVCPPPTLA